VIAEENVCHVLTRDRGIHAILGSGLVKARLCSAESV
jgi:hypothetical protein